MMRQKQSVKQQKQGNKKAEEIIAAALAKIREKQEDDG